MSPFTAKFRQRFALTPCDRRGVLLDLATGAIYELNPVATRICAAFERGETLAAVERDLMATYGIPAAAAARDVRTLLAQLESELPTVHRADVTFGLEAAGFRMRWKGEPVLWFDRQGRVVVRESVPASLADEPAQYLLWAVPHLLTLQRRPLLHASAVRRGDGVLAFHGASGAGKTTLAHRFVAHGSPLISEDLVLLSLADGVPAAYVAGERAARHWVREQAARLERPGRVELDAGGLAEAARGETLPLRELLFVAADRRAGATIEPRPLSHAGALVFLLRNSFAELEQPDIWREILAAMRAVVTTVPIHAATVPNGLAALDAAVRVYSSTSAS